VPHAPPVAFSQFSQKFEGISVFYLYSDTQVIFRGFYWYFWYFFIYKCL
jgi:hypothetical protein